MLASFSNVANTAAIKGNQVFGPYGNARDFQGTINTAKGFTGQYTDSVSGLDYYNSRYYDQVAGVFLSADVSQGNGSGANPYGYVSGNPETKNDPSGQIGLPPVTTQPPATSNPLTWPKLQIPPEEPAPVEVCFLLCPTLGVVGVVGIATVLAIGLFFLTSPAEHLYDPQRPVVIAAYLTRSSEEFYGSNGPTQLTFQPHSSPPQTQTGSGGQGVIPPIPVATAGGFCSFTSDTQVTTEHGEKAISKLHAGDKVLAYDPKTHKMELQPVLHVWTHADHDLIDLTITTTTASHRGISTPSKSEVVHTTSEHPFLTTEQGFVPASKVKDGMHILQADGSVGVVTSRKVVPGTKVMYNLEVAQDHTFTVGDGQWVVHNECSPNESKAPRKLYHYTTPNGQAGILQSQSLNPSLQPPNIVFGTGQYLTDIAPEQIVGRTLADLTQDQIDEGSISFSQLARRLYGQPWGMGNKLSRFLEIDVSGLAVENPAPNIFLLSGTEPLDLSGRIIDFGTTPFAP